ncbi:MAG TPA: ferric reductase-like transmembrane domain-containing protein [Cyclobacteriaceae bacterium]|nr:ferric reductase-like transmembrane domain-containing protein [Cyclobacteriaceae bacterium]
MATGYTSIILLGITLIIGPLNVIKRNHNPVSTDLRRDIGIWCGVIGLVHVVVGIQVHMGNIWLYFVKAVEGNDKYALRSDLFGTANYTGLLAATILLLLLVLSNDLSLRILKPGRWKNLQRWSYAGFILILAHSVIYQVIEKRASWIIFLFAVITIIPITLQSIGLRKSFMNRKS